MSLKPIRGIYKVMYGICDHKHIFISTREEVEKLKKRPVIWVRTSKNHQEELLTEEIKLVTEDSRFIELFEQLGLTTNFFPEDWI